SPRLVRENRELVETAGSFAEEALAKNDYEAAQKLSRRALAAAKVIRDRQLITETNKFTARLVKLKKEFAPVQEALTKLDVDSDDSEANLLAGKYFCFQKEDWERGLPYLRKGDDEGLRAQAAEDTSDPPTQDEIIAVGDGWWTLSQDAEDDAKAAMMRRAGHWYSRVADQLIGLTKVRVSQRLQKIDQLPPKLGAKSFVVVNVKQRAVLVGHAAKVGMVDFSHTGKYLSSCDWAGELRVWEVATGKSVTEIAAGEALSGGAFAPDGRTVTGDVGSELRLFDVATGTLKGTLNVGFAPWQSKWSPDGRKIACVGEPAAAAMFDAASGQVIGSLDGHGGRARSADFHPKGRILATACDDTFVRLWDVATLKEKARLTGHTAGVEWVTFSADGRMLGTASADGSARIWDPITGKVKAVLTGHAGVVYVAAFTGGGRTFVTAGEDGTVRFWNPTTGKTTLVVKAHAEAILALAISPDGRLMATGGLDKEVKLWTLTARQ
ncbi:MAG: WD40 repeat domain-containing protein, partial [Planctomycetales bacterium]